MTFTPSLQCCFASRILVIFTIFSPSSLFGQSAPQVQIEKIVAETSSSNTVVIGQLVLIDDWTVPAPQNGILEELAVSEGMNVEKDAPVARLEASLLELERTASEAAWKAAAVESQNDVDLRFAKMTSQVRKNELQRGTSANQKYDRAVSAVEIERMELMLQQAKLSAEQAELKAKSAKEKEAEMLARLRISGWRVAHSSIRTKFAGIVVEVFAREGDWVQEGKPIARIINLDRLRFESLISVSIANGIDLGAEGEFVAADPAMLKEPASTKGKLLFVSPEINPVTKQVRIIVEVDNREQKLRPGLTGSMKF